VRVRRRPGLRVVASPAALDAAVWQDDRAADDDFEPLVLRCAPDETLAIGAVRVEVPDSHAIVEPETGYAAVMIEADEFEERVARHVEWTLPPERPAFAQGAIASVPAKLYLDPSGVATIVVATAYLDDLIERLR
jgi:hypothetical protein